MANQDSLDSLSFRSAYVLCKLIIIIVIHFNVPINIVKIAYVFFNRNLLLDFI